MGADHPKLVTRTVSVKTSRQVRAWLLCASCEQRFNRKGESWTIRNCWQSPESFPLLEGLTEAVPIGSAEGLRVYRSADVPSLKIERFGYFATSVFWRAAVHHWNLDQAGRITFGRHEEPLRRYLASDTAPWPEVFCLLMLVNSTKDPAAGQLMTVPWLSGDREFHKFCFDIPGISFWLMMGDELPSFARRTCAVQNGIVAVTSNNEKERLERAGKMLSKFER